MLELPEAKVDPGFEDVADTDEESVQNNVSSTVPSAARLTLPHRDNGAQLTDSETDNDTTDDQLSQPVGGALKDLSHEGADTGSEDDIATSELVARPGTGQGSNERTDGECGDNEALEGRLGLLFGSGRVHSVNLREGLDPVLGREQATKSGLVVAKEYEGWADDQSDLHHAQGLARHAEIGHGVYGVCLKSTGEDCRLSDEGDNNR